MDSGAPPNTATKRVRRGLLATGLALCVVGSPGAAIADTGATPTASESSEQLAGELSARAGVPLGELTLSASEAAPGGSVTIVGQCLYQGFLPALTIQVYLFPSEGSDPDPFTMVADAGPEGLINVTVTIPADTVPGEYVFDATCYNEDQALGGGFTDFMVLGEVPTSTPTPTTPPSTVTPSPSSPGPTSVAPTASPSGSSTTAATPSSLPPGVTESPNVPTSTSTGDELAETGVPIPAFAAWGGVGVIVLGGLALLAARRRRLQ